VLQCLSQLADVACIGNYFDGFLGCSRSQGHLASEDIRASDHDRTLSNSCWAVQISLPSCGVKPIWTFILFGPDPIAR
jgi:hypothetical protein